jgi:diguanylate cyclase
MAETALHEAGQQRPAALAFASPFVPSAPVSVPGVVSGGLPAACGPLVAQLGAAWLAALADEGDDPAHHEDTPLSDLPAAERTLAELSGRLVAVLLDAPFQPRRAAAIGRALVSADFVGADVLGRSLRVLIVRLPAMIRSSAVAVPADLEHRIAEVTEALANGYVRALRDRTLAEQEAIRRAELDAERILSKQLRHQATHDPLTGLPNRAVAFGRLAAALTGGDALAASEALAASDALAPDGVLTAGGVLGASGTGARVGLCYLDLDGFKVINDRYGHGAGDQLLVTVAERIGRVAERHGVLAARIGGDEFVVVAAASPGMNGMIALATDLLTELSQPVPLRVGRVSVSACAGIVERAAAGTSAEAVVADADAALYQAKSRGAGCWSVYGAARYGSSRQQASA